MSKTYILSLSYDYYPNTGCTDWTGFTPDLDEANESFAKLVAEHDDSYTVSLIVIDYAEMTFYREKYYRGTREN
jgi:hypothetical protein